ncbi:MAG: hypothetical protein HY235_29905 [Acidobacteria bacterium]|nr:hypothetical protein [Acidobacteriota bacterium]
MALRILTLTFLAASLAFPQSKAGVRILLGLTDKEETRWDGSVSAGGARVTAIEGWRFEPPDSISGSSWKAATRPPRLFGAAAQLARPLMVANGVVVFLDQDSDSAELQIQTAQGNFSVRLGEIPYGTQKKALNGRAMADRIPPYGRITSDKEEQDYPAAAAAKDGSLWVAYFEFQHHPEHTTLRSTYREAPANFNDLKQPPGGDRILARKFAGGAWGEPVAMTPGGGDLYRPAIAVNGAGRVWVFWSGNEKGDFELFARSLDNGTPGQTIRLTNAAGSDVFPVATTDSRGQVWVAWQGWRNGRAAILAATEKGNGFSAPATVSASAGHEWNPAIAADGAGRVTVAFESYRNGNYDVFARTANGGAWGKEFVVAGTLAYEAYPSIAYDPQGRLWVAYEEGAERWGKDFGAHDTTGIALYQGRAIRLRGFEKDGRAVELADSLDRVLPGAASMRADDNPRQGDSREWLKPEPQRARDRQPSRPSQNYTAPKNTHPSLHVDSSGRIWLAARSPHPTWWIPIGTVWTEYVVSYDGKWTGPIMLWHSDNLLDNRPALASLKAGELTVIGSSDHRRQFRPAPVGFQAPRRGDSIPDDPYQNDLFSNTITLSPAGGALQVKEAAAPSLAAMDPLDKAEQQAVAAIRNARLKTKHGELRVLRGEFHRHSEVSADGGGDGSILEQWRYMLDAGYMDWVGCCDHDNGGGREYTWWMTQKQTDIFHTPGKFIPMFSYERSVQYPEGHRNVVFAQRGVRTLPRLPIAKEEPVVKAPDTQMLYRYLRQFNGIVAMHTSGTSMGTDWRDNDPLTEPVVEIYQGDRQNYEIPGGPRGNSSQDSIGGWRPKGFVSLALEMGYKMAFQASSDHISTHQSYCNMLVKDFTRQGVLEAFQKRHVYGATDNILADFRCGDYIMGDAFTVDKAPEFRVKLTGAAPFAKVVIVKDNKYVYTSEPKTAKVEFAWRDNESAKGKTSYYYVRGEQEDGEIVWVSPMWVTRN